MDRIIVLYGSRETAEQARTHLNATGIATDRLDVLSASDHGRAVEFPGNRTATDLEAYFRTLLDAESEQPIVDGLIEAIDNGQAVLVVHPRGKVEIEQARNIIEEHDPETVLWRVAPPEAQGGVLGEHAGGFRS